MIKPPFEIGDYVRFINEKQEGTITAILSSGNIVVDIEDGFPIEVTPKEIVKVQSGIQEKIKVTPAETRPAENDEPSLPSPEAFRISQEIRLLVIPAHSKVTTGSLKLYLLNTTTLQFLFSIAGVKGNLQTGIAAGDIKSEQLVFLTSFEREALFEYDSLRITGILHDNRPHHNNPVIRKEFQLPVPDLHQRFPFLPSPYAFAQSVPVYAAAETLPENNDALLEKLQQEFGKVSRKSTSAPSVTAGKKTQSEQQYLRQYGLSNGEIDLHIEELYPNIDGLSNAEIIEIQLRHFRKELDTAILRKASGIVFIHGVGNGILKAEIRKELKAGGFRFKDGDHNRYGYGATEVLL
jgi:hypothetical protein